MRETALYRVQLWRENPWRQCAPLVRLTSEQIETIRATSLMQHAGEQWSVSDLHPADGPAEE